MVGNLEKKDSLQRYFYPWKKSPLRALLGLPYFKSQTDQFLIDDRKKEDTWKALWIFSKYKQHNRKVVNIFAHLNFDVQLLEFEDYFRIWINFRSTNAPGQTLTSTCNKLFRSRHSKYSTGVTFPLTDRRLVRGCADSRLLLFLIAHYSGVFLGFRARRQFNRNCFVKKFGCMINKWQFCAAKPAKSGNFASSAFCGK